MGPCLNADGLVSSRIYVAGRSGCLGVRRARRATEEDRSHSQNFLGPLLGTGDIRGDQCPSRPSAVHAVDMAYDPFRTRAVS